MMIGTPIRAAHILQNLASAIFATPQYVFINNARGLAHAQGACWKREKESMSWRGSSTWRRFSPTVKNQVGPDGRRVQLPRAA